MNFLVIVNDPPYGTERVYNALRLAQALLKTQPGSTLAVFLMADAVLAARAGQKTPEGFYNVERMLQRVISAGGEVLLCGTCMDARGLPADQMMPGVHRSNMDALAERTVSADRVLVF
jgi:uncharacterized protein involved in oxidation of intracellular sulfur